MMKKFMSHRRLADYGVSRSVICGVVVIAMLFAFTPVQSQDAIDQAKPSPDPIEAVEQLAEERNQLDKTLWSPEVQAQEYEQTFVRLWDRIRAARDRFAPLADMPFNKFLIGTKSKQETLDWDIVLSHWQDPAAGEATALTRKQFVDRLDRYRQLGYQVEQVEFHHSEFVPAKGSEPARSEVSTTLHVSNSKQPHRLVVKTNLHVTWSGKRDAFGNHVMDTVEAHDLKLVERQAESAFREIFKASTAPPQLTRLMPVIAQDLDGDGLSEIVVGGLNRVLQNKGDGKFELRKFLEQPTDFFDAAVVADFTGDGHADFLCVGRHWKDKQTDELVPMLFEGNAQGQFAKHGRKAASVEFVFPKAFTAGDIDGDGDLDLFIGQYKFPYTGGSMPTPFYDSNDGNPAALLLNDGTGHFTDVTESHGLAKKRYRRTYSASFFDIDGDDDLDLITVNDFAGVDVFKNIDGKGQFIDITDAALDQRHLFGMAHAFGDYNGDGRLDLYAIGMSSTTARRLEKLGLGPKGKEDLTKMRPAMGYGNRMLLGQADGTFRQAPFNATVARTGWSWGTTNFDFDLDGDRDVYVGNGHTSGQSCADYCTTYWRHDMYSGSSKPSPAMDRLFQGALKDLNANRISWNGFEHNKLLMNRSGESFIDVAWLLGIAFEYDTRSVISDDLDSDGRPDLIITEYQPLPGGARKYHLHVYRNEMATDNHWIGVRLQNQAGANGSPIGVEVTVTTANGKQVGRIVTGDSFSCQHANTIHFGLGQTASVQRVTVKWRDGKTVQLDQPAIDRYHAVKRK